MRLFVVYTLYKVHTRSFFRKCKYNSDNYPDGVGGVIFEKCIIVSCHNLFIGQQMRCGSLLRGDVPYCSPIHAMRVTVVRCSPSTSGTSLVLLYGSVPIH